MERATWDHPTSIRRVVLLEPKSPGFHIWSAMGLPRIGVVLLGTIVRELGYDVTVMVEEKRPFDRDAIFSADLVGISSITATAKNAYELAGEVMARGIPVVMGGPHPTHRTDEALQNCDFVVRGEGEEALPALIKALERGEGYDQIAGLSYHDGDETRHVPEAPLVRDLDRWPDPDFNLVKGFSGSSIFTGKRIVPIQTSRGCPHDCSFCTVTATFGHRMRYRSPERVVAEMAKYDMKRTHFFIYDDNFAANRRRTREMLEAFETLPNGGPQWSTQVRADVATDTELLDTMAARGCGAFYIGLESVNQETLSTTNKRQSFSDVSEHLRRIHSRGIAVHGMFVFGFDTDGPGTMERTVRFAQQTGLFSVQFMVLTPLPGSRLAQELEDDGRVLTQDWSLYDAHHVVFQPAQVTPEELNIWQYEGHKRFYGAPRIAAHLIKRRWFRAIVSVYATQLAYRWRWSNGAYLRSLRQFSLKTPKLLNQSPQPA